MEIHFIVSEPFEAVGLIWEGTLKQAAAGVVGSVIAELQQRLHEIAARTDPPRIVGVSWPRADGVRYFVGAPIAAGAAAPEGMIRVSVPGLEYVSTTAERGQGFRSYQALFAWMADRALAHDTSSLNHIEEYPVDYDPQASPRFKLLIPVLRQSPAAEDDI